MDSKKKVSDERGRLPFSRPLSYHAQRRPLIDYCTNEWQDNPRYALHRSTPTFGDRFEDTMDSYFDVCLAFIQSRKFRRLSLSMTCLWILAVVVWFTKLGPYIEETRAVTASLKINAAGGLFGASVLPHFPDMTQIRTLDPKLLPRESNSKHDEPDLRRRLIFIGDIHGCKEELRALLNKLKFDSKTDHIITTGDMIAKGPDSLGVVDILRKNDASCVRGNHEDRIVLLAAQLKSPLRQNQQLNSSDLDRLEEQSFSHADAKDRKLARSLDPVQLEYLRSCPVILQVGEMKSLGGRIVVVHAGLVPGVPLQNQDPVSVMTMRSIDLSSHVPSKDYDQKGSIAWTKLWNRYQQLLPAAGWTLFSQPIPERENSKDMHTTVIYGHDSKRGLQIEKYTKGLDTGCVKGGKLTALVLTDGGRHERIHVNCKDYSD